MRRIATLVVAVLAACSNPGATKKAAPEQAAASGAEETAAASSPAESAAQRPASLTDADVALADGWVTLYGEYASAMESAPAAADCARASSAIREINTKNADLIGRGKPRMAALRRDPAAAKWVDAHYKKSLGAALDRMAPTLDRCRGNAEVSAALAEGCVRAQGRLTTADSAAVGVVLLDLGQHPVELAGGDVHAAELARAGHADLELGAAVGAVLVAAREPRTRRTRG